MRDNKIKIYTSAPLPFQGQKKNHVKTFVKIIRRLQPSIVVDLFGGSGLLSHVAKRTCPHSRVIYNDYDNYCERLAHVHQTNVILSFLRKLLRDYQEGEKLTGSIRETILQRLEQEHARGYVDWITLSSSLCFSMNYATDYMGMVKNTFYNKLRTADYVTDGYLDGLEIVRTDYSELCQQYRNQPGVLFVADPPYLSTDVKTYRSANYWTLKDYLNVLTTLNDVNYIYFTSNKSQVVDLCKWLDTNEGKVRNVFNGAIVTTIKSMVTSKLSYTDIMMYKLNTI
jgi:16S rRNA G966 N2-methylase RsmD